MLDILRNQAAAYGNEAMHTSLKPQLAPSASKKQGTHGHSSRPGTAGSSAVGKPQFYD